jgi:hypothetical protein
MKTTKCCRGKWHMGERELPLSAFPHRHTEADGLAPICKVCNNRAVRIAQRRGVTKPALTDRVLQLLADQNVPCQAGGARFGHPYIDAVAHGCVRIEIKQSLDQCVRDSVSYHWTFNRRQVIPGYCDVVILIGTDRYGHEDVFVMTQMEALSFLNEKANQEKGGAISCVIGSKHGNAKIWARLVQWKYRFDVIEDVRQEYAQGLRRLIR